MSNLTSSLILYGKITTTLPKAKATKSEAERIIAKCFSIKDPVTLTRYLNNNLYGGARIKLQDIVADIKSVSVIKSTTRFGDGGQTAIVVLNMKESAEKTEAPKEAKTEKKAPASTKDKVKKGK
jgi:ribosomal protein L17